MGSFDSPVLRTQGSLNSPVHMTAGSHFKMLITQPRSKVNQNGPSTSLMGPGGAVWEKNWIQKISWDCPFKRIYPLWAPYLLFAYPIGNILFYFPSPLIAILLAFPLHIGKYSWNFCGSFHVHETFDVQLLFLQAFILIWIFVKNSKISCYFFKSCREWTWKNYP